MMKETNKRLFNPVGMWFFLLILLIGVNPPVFADTQVSISLSENLVSIGDQINVKIIVKTTETVDKIKLTPEEGEYELVDQQATSARKQQDYTVFEKDLKVAFFKTGEFKVGPFDVELLKGETSVEIKKTNSVPVTVKTVLTDEDTDIKDIKSPIEVKGNPFYVLKYFILAFLVVLIIIFLIIWWRRRRNKVTVEQPSLSPLEEFIARIRELAGKKYYEKGNVKNHFLELTQILKHFLFRKYTFNAEDLTTYETMLALGWKEKDPTVQDNLRFLFNLADLVKFAKFVPDSSAMTEVFNKLEYLVTTYKQREAAELQLSQAQPPQQQEATKPIAPKDGSQ